MSIASAPARPTRERLLRVSEVAEALNISTRQAYRLVSEGHFRALRVGGSLRVAEGSLWDYVRRQMDLYSLESGFCDSHDQD